MSEPAQYSGKAPKPAELNDDVGLAPADAYGPLVEAFKKGVDRTLLRENLKLSVDQRARKMQAAIKAADELRGIAWKPRKRDSNQTA